MRVSNRWLCLVDLGPATHPPHPPLGWAFARLYPTGLGTPSPETPSPQRIPDVTENTRTVTIPCGRPGEADVRRTFLTGAAGPANRSWGEHNVKKDSEAEPPSGRKEHRDWPVTSATCVLAVCPSQKSSPPPQADSVPGRAVQRDGHAQPGMALRLRGLGSGPEQ